MPGEFETKYAYREKMKMLSLNKPLKGPLNTLQKSKISETKNMIAEYLVDKKFYQHFRHLKQVFMYITNNCNATCKQCIYKPNVIHYSDEEIPLKVALSLLKIFNILGASKVTFLGGEPTLYGHEEEHKPLFNLITKTKDIGYKYIRLDTNGLSMSQLLPNPSFKQLNEIAFSLDGFSAKINDPLRGEGTFERTLESIKQAIDEGYKVTITCCVHKFLLTRDQNRTYMIENMIRFAEKLGVLQINFHDLFKTGVPMDTWTGNFSPTPEEWVLMYDELTEKIYHNKFRIKIRLPQCFITKKEFASNPQYYGYCPVKLGERVMVHPNGIIRICSNLICTALGTARYNNKEILWDNTNTNELVNHVLDLNTPCTNRSKCRQYGELVPLCFSFKPNQNEFVWESELNWDNKDIGV